MRQIPFLRGLDDESKLRLKDAVPGWAISRVRPNAIRVVKPPTREVHGTGIPMFALVCTWFEEDIVHASVRNAFAQGAQRVFLLDNDSPDGTVAEAEAAGAELGVVFTTDHFDEMFKYRLVNLQIEMVSKESGLDRIWWLMMDADEFLEVPGRTVLDFVAGVDRRCRVVGARVFDHYPTPGVPTERRVHPLAAQPRFREKTDHRCTLGHHKHPVFLWDRTRRPIIVEPGFHQMRCHGEALYEPTESLTLHHFPFRNEDDTRRRLDLLAERGATAETRRADADGHMRARRQSVDAVYRGDYASVIDYRTGTPGIEVEEWSGQDVR